MGQKRKSVIVFSLQIWQDPTDSSKPMVSQVILDKLNEYSKRKRKINVNLRRELVGKKVGNKVSKEI